MTTPAELVVIQLAKSACAELALALKIARDRGGAAGDAGDVGSIGMQTAYGDMERVLDSACTRIAALDPSMVPECRGEPKK